MEVHTVASRANGETTVDVTAQVSATSFGVLGWRYWLEELSVWRDGTLRLAAVNHRYVFGGRIQRQQWDVFTRTPEGLSGQRVQGKTLAEFQTRYPAFAGHWSPDQFGLPWLPDYNAAPPERRRDLDLPRTDLVAGIGTPLAMAFYWIRWDDDARRRVPIFLPGFKKDSRVDIDVETIGIDAAGVRHLRSSVSHPQLGGTRPSTGDAWVAADHRLTRVRFDAYGALGTAHGDLELEACSGD